MVQLRQLGRRGHAVTGVRDLRREGHAVDPHGAALVLRGRPDRLVAIGGHGETGPAGQPHERQHVTAGDRGDEGLLGIDAGWIGPGRGHHRRRGGGGKDLSTVEGPLVLARVLPLQEVGGVGGLAPVDDGAVGGHDGAQHSARRAIGRACPTGPGLGNMTAMGMFSSVAGRTVKRVSRARVMVPLSAAFALAMTARPARAEALPTAAELKQLSARLAPVDLTADVTRLSAAERAALARIVRAAALMDTLFMRQAWAGNETLLLRLAQDPSPRGRERLHAFRQNRGPWLRLDGDRPFLPGVGEKPAAGTFYPADATKVDLEAWLKGLAAPARASASGFFTTIRRGPDGKLTIVPYGVEYQPELARAAALLREAAARTEQPTLRAYLE